MNNYWSKLKSIFFRINQRVPYIPDFSDIWNIFKILLVSLFICVIYSFGEVQRVSDFYLVFWKNINVFLPYIVMQLLGLILFAKRIQLMPPFLAIMFMVGLNFLCVYFIHSLLNNSFIAMFKYWDSSISKVFVSLGILFFFLIYFDWREKNIHPTELKVKFNFLQSKMRPHFLFNTLNSIVSLIKINPDIAKKMILNLSEILRASLREEESDGNYRLREEIELCKKYLDIEKMRLGDRLEVIWTIEDGVSNAKVPRLFLQPLIENSILHGIQNIEEGGCVEVKIVKNLLSNIVFEIKNPVFYEGLNNIKSKNGNNISLKNIVERLKIYYDGAIEFKTEYIDDNFYVYFVVPYRF